MDEIEEKVREHGANLGEIMFISGMTPWYKDLTRDQEEQDAKLEVRSGEIRRIMIECEVLQKG